MFNFLTRSKEIQQLPYSTDVHCHIVPGVDDGSPDPTVSAELIERMKSWGIRTIIATPHVTQDTFENTPETLDPAFDKLCDEIRRRDIEISISMSAEYRIDDFFRHQLEAGNVTTMPNNLILVENSYLQEPWNLDQFLYDLKLKGLRPILAHPERYLYYGRTNPGRYEQIHRSGTFLQINLLSLAGYYGKEEKKTAERLIEEELVDFVGTDLHHHRHADKIEEYLHSKAFRKIAPALANVMNDRAFLPKKK